MRIRDRVKELRRVQASLLRPNPKNWRTHPERQRDVLRGVLAEIGYADALLARELADGSLELIDGHLRAETTPEAEVPVLIVDVNEAEAALLLATLDPLTALAGRDDAALESLLAATEVQSDAVQQFLAELTADREQVLEDSSGSNREVALPETFQVLVECASEAEQREVFERLTGDGHKCRAITL
jgi:ParB-like chromosome segregation protein Spo0J